MSTTRSFIPIYEPFLEGNEKKYVLDCLESGWISSKGSYIEKFEKAFMHYTGAKHATTVSNGTVALHLALETLGIREGDEVIVPTFTYVASVNTIMHAGATPLFVDSEETTLQINLEAVIKKITPKTKAILAVHLYGIACDIVALAKICQQHNLFLIEDCAEALGTFIHQKHVGTFGHVSTFSFFGNKTITTGEGGMLITNDPLLIAKACHLKSQGVSKDREYWHDVLAYNYRMTNICAAIGLAQLEQIEDILHHKTRIAAGYKQVLHGCPLRVLEPSDSSMQSSYWLCTIILDDHQHVKNLREFLKINHIETRPTFPPVHLMPHSRSFESFPVAENISQRGINLPSFPALTDDEIAFIGEKIVEYYNDF